MLLLIKTPIIPIRLDKLSMKISPFHVTATEIIKTKNAKDKDTNNTMPTYNGTIS